VIEKSIFIEPVPHPPELESAWMIASDELALASESTRVFHGSVASKRPPPIVLPPDPDDDDDEEEDDDELELAPLPELDEALVLDDVEDAPPVDDVDDEVEAPVPDDTDVEAPAPLAELELCEEVVHGWW
jgi:hypothetical protein